MNAIRVLIVDDQALIRDGLQAILSTQPDIAVVGEAEHGAVALQLVGRLSPQVVLMDVRMPVLDGVATTRSIREHHPSCRVILLTTFDNDEYIFEGLRAGAVGYLLKTEGKEHLIEAIRAVARGETALQPAIVGKVVAEFARLSPLPATLPEHELFSVREREVLYLLSQGYSNHAIAEHLVLTTGTVKNHLTNIFDKLGANNRVQAIVRAKELGLV